MFMFVSLFSVGCQIFLVEVGGEYTSTGHLNLSQWLITIALGALSIPVGVLMRFIPVKEDPNAFFGAEIMSAESSTKSKPVASSSSLQVSNMEMKSMNKYQLEDESEFVKCPPTIGKGENSNENIEA